jgi:hypothetical protein
LKPATTVVVAFLAFVALIHLYRLIAPFEVTIAGNQVAQWVSLPVAIVAAALAWLLAREARSG